VKIYVTETVTENDSRKMICHCYGHQIQEAKPLKLKAFNFRTSKWSACILYRILQTHETRDPKFRYTSRDVTMTLRMKYSQKQQWKPSAISNF